MFEWRGDMRISVRAERTQAEPAKSFKVKEQREDYVSASALPVTSAGNSSSNSSPSNESQTEEELRERLDTIRAGSKVIHKKFGKGDVVKINKNEKFIYVRFWGGEKKFIFPDAFLMGFLEMEL
ncbi:MAG: hypothetical protein IKB39_04175 [Bacteroidaceae bacterium]|nr:hypothetical protein [Bacteroidaceae bacterium]